MNYRHSVQLGVLIGMLMLVSGCFSTSDVSSIQDHQTEQAAPTDTLSPTLENAATETVTLTPEQHIIQQLSALPERYSATRRALLPEQKPLLVQALNALANAKIDEGLAHISKAEAMAELNSAGYVVKADLLLAAEQTDAAKAALEQALAVNADNPKAANRLAQIMRQQGDFARALALYTQAIDADPMHAPSYRNRGVLNDLYLGDKAAALEDYQVYAALLAHYHGDEQSKEIKQAIKLVNIWIVDVDRQLQTIASTQNED